MGKRRGILSKLAAFPEASIEVHCPQIEGYQLEGIDLCEGSKVNTAPFGALPPGTVKIGKAKQNRNGTWTIPFEYRAQGWEDEQASEEDADYLAAIGDIIKAMRPVAEIEALAKGCPDPERYSDREEWHD